MDGACPAHDERNCSASTSSPDSQITRWRSAVCPHPNRPEVNIHEAYLAAPRQRLRFRFPLSDALGRERRARAQWRFSQRGKKLRAKNSKANSRFKQEPSIGRKLQHCSGRVCTLVVFPSTSTPLARSLTHSPAQSLLEKPSSFSRSYVSSSVCHPTRAAAAPRDPAWLRVDKTAFY